MTDRHRWVGMLYAGIVCINCGVTWWPWTESRPCGDVKASPDATAPTPSPARLSTEGTGL